MDGKRGEGYILPICSRESCVRWLYELLRIICIIYGRWLVANGGVRVGVLLSKWSDEVVGTHIEQMYYGVCAV